MGDTLTITKLDHSATRWIEQESLRTGESIEVIARGLLYKGLELQRAKPIIAPHLDLDALAGTWSAEDAEEFRQATAEMNQVDPSAMAVSGILFDTNAYVAFKQGKAEAREIVRNASTIGLGSIVVGELLAGFALGKRQDQNRLELQQFLGSDRVHVLSVDQDTSASYALIYQTLRVKGRPIPTNDMWIAASAMQHGFSLFTYDAHFQEVPGIRAGASWSELA